MIMKCNIRGILPAILTPFTTGGAKVDYEKACEFANYLAKKGVDGLFVCGTTGEGQNLSPAERKTLAAEIMDAVGKRLKIVVHTGYIDSIHTDENLEYNPDWPLLIGVDYGRTPAAVVLQFHPTMGRYHCLWEFTTHDNDHIGSAVDFGPELVRLLRSEHPESETEGWNPWGDPAGEGKKENSNESAAAILRASGLPIRPSPDLSNNFDLRQSSVDSVLKRLCFDGRPAMTLREIGEHLGITRERVRQIQNEALARLHQALLAGRGGP